MNEAIWTTENENGTSIRYMCICTKNNFGNVVNLKQISKLYRKMSISKRFPISIFPWATSNKRLILVQETVKHKLWVARNEIPTLAENFPPYCIHIHSKQNLRNIDWEKKSEKKKQPERSAFALFSLLRWYKLRVSYKV